jgi:hypothetical protein
MKTESFVRRHPVLSYFLLAYGVTGCGILWLLAIRGFDRGALPTVEKGLGVAWTLLGSSASGLVLTTWLDGRAGLRGLWSLAVRWRFGWVWAAVALLTAPLLMLAILWPLTVWVDPTLAPGFK